MNQVSPSSLLSIYNLKLIENFPFDCPKRHRYPLSSSKTGLGKLSISTVLYYTISDTHLVQTPYLPLVVTSIDNLSVHLYRVPVLFQMSAPIVWDWVHVLNYVRTKIYRVCGSSDNKESSDTKIGVPSPSYGLREMRDGECRNGLLTELRWS